MSSYQDFLRQYPDVTMFEVLLPDINGIMRGKWIARGNLEKVFDDGFKMPVSTTSFDIWGRDIFATVFDDGDADGICLPVEGTLSMIPWLQRPTGQLLMQMGSVRAGDYAGDPRTVLKRVLERYDAIGLTPVVATELEFYLLAGARNEDGGPVHTQLAGSGALPIGGQTYSIDVMRRASDLMHGVYEACELQAIPVDTLITEAAPSQFEINLHHQPDALLACDQSLLLKRAIKGVAAEHGMQATFMAKPFGDLAGNGMHIHCSILDRDGRNIFDNGTEQGGPLLQHATAGCLDTMADVMALFAPNSNSFRRFRLASHAPHAPCWGYENRTTAVRIPADSPEATRLEHRVAGADVNPYLAVAAVLAGALVGIERKLTPPEPTVGDAYAQHAATLPRFWQDALRRFEQSEFVAEYLGTELRRIFLDSKWQELEELIGHVPLVEYDAYLDL